VINPAVGEQFSPVASVAAQAVLAKHGVTPGYILYVGNLRGSKNTDGLLKAYSKYRSAVSDPRPLVLVGKNAGGMVFPDGVRHLNNVSHTDLPAFYSAAAVFVFPSFYEGFGLPPLEAMACGTPVIASNAGSLPEVCSDAARYINPFDTDALADTIRAVLAAPDQQRQMSERGLKNAQRFSWSRFAQQTWELYERVAP
jgi:glycosyltransferase involved in cell wall biosynthesis